MNNYIKHFFLLLPILCYLQVFNDLVFDIELPISFPYFFLGGDNPNIMDAIFTMMIIILSFVIGVIYTAYNKLWLWLFAYICFGGGLWFFWAF